MDTPATILAVDDHQNVLDCIVRVLEAAGYRVLAAQDGVEALSLLEGQRVDLIVADISMPRMNGYQLYTKVTENPEWVAIPFIFLTARTLDSDVRYGRELGVDDYVTKPFQREDLLATIRGRLRRARQLAQANPTSRPDVLSVGELRIDLAQHRVWAKEEQVKLSAREFKLLACLARQQSKTVPLQELVQETHGLDTDHTEAGSLLRPLIRSVRRKLGYHAGQMGCIESVRGVGYRLLSSR
jgi:two-component system alkaline phosphatase synthesis response regulator PhoP